MVNQLPALARLWTDRATISIKSKTTDANTKITSFSDQVLASNVPCKLSFETLTSTSPDTNAAVSAQSVKLFMGLDQVIPAGSKITVIRNDEIFEFSKSGEAGRFRHHQEIPLELFKGWS